MYISDHLIAAGTPEWFARRTVEAGSTFLGIMGFFYVFNAPLTKSEALLPALCGAIAIQIGTGFLEWRRARPSRQVR